MRYYCGWEKVALAVLLAVTLLLPDQVSATPDRVVKKTAEAAAETPGETPESIAKVNGKTIPYAGFSRQMEMMKMRVLKGQPGQIPEVLLQQMQAQVVNQLIAEELLIQESRNKGIKIAPNLVEAELLNFKQRFGNNDAYQAALKRKNKTEDDLKAQIVHDLAVRKLVESELLSKIVVSEAEAKKYYDENQETFHRPERVRVQHIRINANSVDYGNRRARARKKLEDIKKKMLGGADFSQLAKDHSEGESNVRGGDLGYITRGQLPKSYEEAAFNLAPNEVSDIVENELGFHFFKVTDRQKAKTPTFEEVKTEIDQILRGEQLKKQFSPYIEGLKAKAKIEIFIN